MEDYENKHEYDDGFRPNDISPEQEKYEREEEIRKAYETIEAQKLAMSYGWIIVCENENDPEDQDTITLFSREEPSDWICNLAMKEDWGDYAEGMTIKRKLRIVGHLADDLSAKYGDNPIPF